MVEKSYWHKKTKIFKKIWKENDKNWTWIRIGHRERERNKSFLKSLKKWRTREKSCFKKLFDWFLISRKLDSIDRKSHSIDPASIKKRSSQATLNQGFYRIFDRSRDRFDRSKIWKKHFFEKQSMLMQKLLKAHYFMNEMHEYKMKSFSKTLEFNPDLPKTRFSINLSSKLKH